LVRLRSPRLALTGPEKEKRLLSDRPGKRKKVTLALTSASTILLKKIGQIAGKEKCI
jgi:hypothetical protein